MDPLEIFAQILGLIGAGIYIASFQIKKVRALFYSQLFGSVFFVIHFLLLGAYAGALQNSLSIIRAILLLFSDRKWAHNIWTLLALNVCFIISGIVTYSGLLSLLPVIAMIASTFAMWTGNAFKIRVTQLAVTSPFWLVYNASVISISGIITESFNIISVIVSFIRYGKFEDNDSNSSNDKCIECVKDHNDRP